VRVYVDYGNTFVFRDLPVERNEEVRTLGAHWDKIRKAWIVPASVLVALSVINSPRQPGDDISELEAWLGKLRHKILLSEQCVPPNGQTVMLKNSPMTHQDVGQNRLRYMKRNGFWWDMGSGKTYGSLWVAEELFKFEAKSKVLIMCPVSLMSTWREEMEAHLTVIPKVIEIKGPKNRRSKLLQEWMKPNPIRLTFGIMSWDVGRRMVGEFPPDFKFDFIIGDETGFIKNKAAERTQAAIAIADRSEYVVALNGTPYISNVTDFWAQMRFIGEMYSGPSFMRFAERYMEMDENSRKIPKNVKEEMKPELKELMGYAGMSVRKEDVMPELPERSYSVRWVEPTGDQKEAIDRAMDEFHFAVDAVKKGAETSTQQFVLIKNAMSRITKVQQIGMGWTKNAEGDIIYFKDNAKGEAVLDLSEEARGQKVVIFSRFVEDLWVMEKLLGKAGFHAVSYHGRMPAEHAENARQLFTKGNAEYFLSQVQKGGFGLNLQMSHTCAFTNNWWSYGVRSQAEGRLHRKGQKNAVLYVDIALKNSIDEYLVNSFKQQKDLVNYLFGKRMSEADLIKMAGDVQGIALVNPIG
jgi:SNF2 family DNA or RNA helicase